MIPWDQKWTELRAGDVYPLPFATETNWADGWVVNILILEASDTHGYQASLPIWSYEEQYDPDRGKGQDEAQRVTQVALHAFADRLRHVLNDHPSP